MIHKTPIEMLTGKRPNFKFLRRFGSTCYATLPKDKRDYTLSEKAKRCILIGHTELGYILETKKRFVTCHVRFFHDTNPEKTKINENDDDYSDQSSEEDITERKTHKVTFRLIDDDQTDEEEISDDEASEAFQSLPPTPIPVEKTSARERYDLVLQDEDQSAPRDINLNVSSDNVIGDMLAPRATRSKTANEATTQVTWKDPLTYQDAMNHEKKDEWICSVRTELGSLKQNGTFGPIQPLPEGRTAVGCKWVFKTKRDALGNVDKFKARLVAKGYTQKRGQDFDQTFAPVASIIANRLILSISTNMRMIQICYDVANAYLNSIMDKIQFLEIPEGYELVENFELIPGVTLVLPVLKGLYGFKQSAKLWNDTLKKVLEDAGLIQNRFEPAIFARFDKHDILVVSTYVDDLIIASTRQDWLSNLVKRLRNNF